jgi:carnosine N-methyltransferase
LLVNAWAKYKSKVIAKCAQLLTVKPALACTAQRVEGIKRALQLNLEFLQHMEQDLAQTRTSRNLAVVVHGPAPRRDPALASLFALLSRDWTIQGNRIHSQTYDPLVTQLQNILPPGKCVLVPGAGAGRLVYEMYRAGYAVEACEIDVLATTALDWIFNFSQTAHECAPYLHHFRHNFHGDAQDQLMTACVPDVAVREGPLDRAHGPHAIAHDATAECSSEPEASSENCDSFPCTAGAEKVSQRSDPAPLYPATVRHVDFIPYYSAKSKQQTFDAVVTCYFIDMPKCVIDCLEVIDHVLKPGGFWINLGPLHYSLAEDAGPDLSYDEVLAWFQFKGYTIVSNTSQDLSYSRDTGTIMYREQYTVAWSCLQKPMTTSALP